jgi:hypothetical protein
MRLLAESGRSLAGLGYGNSTAVNIVLLYCSAGECVPAAIRPVRSNRGEKGSWKV